MTDQPQGARIVTMQQNVMNQPVEHVSDVERYLEILAKLDVNNRMCAERELAQAYADGYEIADVTVSVGERVIATVWTLRQRRVVEHYVMEDGIRRMSERQKREPPQEKPDTPIHSTRLR